MLRAASAQLRTRSDRTLFPFAHGHARTRAHALCSHARSPHAHARVGAPRTSEEMAKLMARHAETSTGHSHWDDKLEGGASAMAARTVAAC